MRGKPAFIFKAMLILIYLIACTHIVAVVSPRLLLFLLTVNEAASAKSRTTAAK